MEKEKTEKELADMVAKLYKEKITVVDLQAKLLKSSIEIEEPGPTSEKDKKIQGLIYNYLQSNKSGLTKEQIENFKPDGGGGWICVGRSITEFLSLVPNTSLDALISHANEKGYELEVAE